jgi:cyclase
MRIEQITPGAYLFIGNQYASNSAVFVRGDDALLIDAVGSTLDARDLRTFVTQELRKQVRLIVMTHYFADHMAALNLFPEAEVIAHQNYRQTWDGEQFRSDEELAFYREPTILVGNSMRVQWGAFDFRLAHNPGHTSSTMCIDLPALGITFIGDTAVGSIAYVRYGDPQEALHRIAALGPRRYIASHGGIRTDDVPGKALGYLRALRRGERRFKLEPFEQVFHERNLETIAS